MGDLGPVLGLRVCSLQLRPFLGARVKKGLGAKLLRLTCAGECMDAVSSELSFFTLPNCFELFGFDLLADEDWHLWLLEVP